MVRTLTSLTSAPMQEALGRISLAYLAYKLVVRGLDLYWRLFMRATQLISRRQELRADELACYVAGSRSFIGGMQSIHGASAVLPAFWQNEMVPALEAGYRLPIGEGFARFMAAPAVSRAIANALDTALKQSETAPFDTHPPLAVRVAAARQHPFRELPATDPQATVLIDDLPALELELLGMMGPPEKVAELKPLNWDQTSDKVFIPSWRKYFAECGSAVEGIFVESLPDALKDSVKIAAHLRDVPGSLLTPEQRGDRVRGLLWIAFALALLDNGWELHSQPGELYLKRDEERLEPMEIVRDILTGTISRAVWSDRSRSLGIAALQLRAGRQLPPAVTGS